MWSALPSRLSRAPSHRDGRRPYRAVAAPHDGRAGRGQIVEASLPPFEWARGVLVSEAMVVAIRIVMLSNQNCDSSRGDVSRIRTAEATDRSAVRRVADLHHCLRSPRDYATLIDATMRR